MKTFIERVPKYTFFTGKGGVGKTSMACTTSILLAEKGNKVLLVSTDPASNLDEVLETTIGSVPTPINGVNNLWAINIDPIKAAQGYKERMVAPYRNILPEATIKQMEEQLSGACTVEIAGFNEFSRLLGDSSLTEGYDNIILDTAPTGHTLRLLNLPSAWNDFIESNRTGSSCLGPVSGLKEQKKLFEQVLASLKNPKKTLITFVTRPEPMAFSEVSKTAGELQQMGLTNNHLIINGIFKASSNDKIALSFEKKTTEAIKNIPENLKIMPTTKVSFYPNGLIGVKALKNIYNESDTTASGDFIDIQKETDLLKQKSHNWKKAIEELSSHKKGVIMTMGKGGVGKTTIAAMIALELAEKGHKVTLSTTDPADHISGIIENIKNITIEKINPQLETKKYVENVLRSNAGKLSKEDMELLEEEMKSPCIEEIAVFNAFAETISKGGDHFVVLETAPTGHTLLLLDATQSYHREVAKSVSTLPDSVLTLLPKLRDKDFTKIFIVTLPESTPVHEAASLQNDLKRADIYPYGWIINKSFFDSGTTDTQLVLKSINEIKYISEVIDKYSKKTIVTPWSSEELQGGNSFVRYLNNLKQSSLTN